MLDTMTVPAMATPNEEPKFETLRDRPDISPWSSSEKLDCTTLTEDVNMTPTPKPTRKRPGTKGRTVVVPGTSHSRRITDQAMNTLLSSRRMNRKYDPRPTHQ